MLTGKVFHRQIAVGKKIWLYVFVMHWIHLYLVSDPLVWAVELKQEWPPDHCECDTA